MVKERTREKAKTPKSHRADRRTRRSDIPWELIAGSLAKVDEHNARLWINGNEVEPQSRFAHLNHRYD